MPGVPLLDLAKSVYYTSDFHKKQILIASHHSVLVLFVGRNLFTYHNSNIVDHVHDQSCVRSIELVLITQVSGYRTKCWSNVLHIKKGCRKVFEVIISRPPCRVSLPSGPYS